MKELKQIDNKSFLRELRIRITENKISEEEVFIALEKPQSPELITEYKKVNYSKLTKEGWKKACETLEKDKSYQEEIKL